MIEIYPIPAFVDNYIWLIYEPNQKKGYVVDPGDHGPVEHLLEEQGIELCGILITHHHADHVGGVNKLCENRDIPVYGPASESIPHITQPLREGDQVELPDLDLAFKVLDVPGHTAGHIAYYHSGGEPLLFCGDCLFSGGCGRLFEGTAEQMFASLSKFQRLPSETRVYCTHEYTQANLKFALAVEPENPDLQEYNQQVAKTREAGKPTLPSTIALENKINPFLRSDVAAVKQNLEQHTGQSLPQPVDVFRATRAWKDNF